MHIQHGYTPTGRLPSRRSHTPAGGRRLCVGDSVLLDTGNCVRGRPLSFTPVFSQNPVPNAVL